MTDSPDVKAVFRRAYSRMKRWGKCNGVNVDQDGRVCAFGAIYGARPGGGHLEKGPVGPAYDALRVRVGDPVTMWSDANDEATVLRVLREMGR